MRIARPIVLFAAFAMTVGGIVSDGLGCPFCSAPSLTLSEQLAQSDAVVLTKWAGATKPKEDQTGSTQFEITEVVRGPEKDLKKGGRVLVQEYRAARPGDLFLLLGNKGASIEWGSPLAVTETSFKYMTQAPLSEVPTQQRLAYFLRFLEFPDSMIADDAYAEFANAPYKDIAPLAEIMPLEKIRKWVTGDEIPATRLGLYGLFLGLCGSDEDAKLMEAKITEQTTDYRLGMDGVMSGYLLLTGAKGLDLMDKAKLRNTEVPFSETYAAMQAVRFMWNYAEGRIDKDRLRQSMRVLLDRPELADLVIADLARWKDWSVQDRLMTLFGAEEYDIPAIKRAIVRYMLVSTKDVPTGEEKTPKHVERARKHLAALREKDPKTVREAERFFFPR